MESISPSEIRETASIEWDTRQYGRMLAMCNSEPTIGVPSQLQKIWPLAGLNRPPKAPWASEFQLSEDESSLHQTSRPSEV